MSTGLRQTGQAAGHWVASGLIVVAAHAAVAWVVLPQTNSTADAMPAGALMVELAPVAVARADVPADAAPGPDQLQSAPAPRAGKTTEDKPDDTPPRQAKIAASVAEVVRAPDPDPLPLPDDPDRAQPRKLEASPPAPAAPHTSASRVVADRKGAVAATAAQGSPGAQASPATMTWVNRMLQQIERNKRYPAAAQSRREEGTAHVAFTIDRRGQLVSAGIRRSSGSAALDAEALEILNRSQPFPMPPVELAGDTVPLTVPIRFRFRG